MDEPDKRLILLTAGTFRIVFLQRETTFDAWPYLNDLLQINASIPCPFMEATTDIATMLNSIQQ